MVEKVSRPDAPPPYRVEPSKETKDDKSRHEEEEERKESFQRKDKSSTWEKFSGRSLTVRTVKVARERIDRVLFGKAVLRGGVCILQTTVVYKDGRRTEPALFMLPRPEDYIKFKLYTRGRPVPEEYWAHGPEIQFGIVEIGSVTGSWNLKEEEGKEEARALEKRKKSGLLAALRLIDKDTGAFQWFNLLMYLFGMALAALVLYYAWQ
jgi:hypothetical protein